MNEEFKEIKVKYMKRKALIARLGAIAALSGGLLLFAACPNLLEKEPEPTRYTVNFSAGAGRGTAPASQTVEEGKNITLPDQGNMMPPAGSDRTFTGWTAGGKTYAAGTTFTVNGNTSFVAQWTSASSTTYTISFTTGEGGGTAPASQTLTYGTSITLPDQGNMTAPTGKTFDGWTTGYQDYAAGATIPVLGNTVFTAQWTSESSGYTISFTTGDGTGTPPASQKVAHGTDITLPGKGDMIAPTGKTFAGWKNGDTTKQAGESFTVYGPANLIAQWAVEPIDPAKTYVEFNNLEEFPVVIYSDPSHLTEIARVPAEGTGHIETDPKPQGTSFYPQFLLEFEGIPITYDGAIILLRVDEKKVNKANISKLSSIQTGSAFIKIENNSNNSMTFNKGNSELSSLGTNTTIISTMESAAYRIEPGAASQYAAMKNGSTPIAFPSQVSQFEAEMLYIFAYNGTSLTLSSTQSVMQALTMLPAPTQVAVSMATSSISLTWSAVENATSYKVYRSSALDGQDEFLETVSASPYTGSETLSPGTSYYYKVQALNAERESPLSTAAAVMILPSVQGLAAQVKDAASISLSWSAVEGAAEYKVYRSSGQSYEPLKTVSGLTTYTDESPSVGTGYTYKIQAVNTQTAGISLLSTEYAARILAAPQLSPQTASATSITLSWEAVTGATTYKLHRSSSPDTDFTIIQTLSQQTYTDQGLSEGTTYYYKVQGTNAQGDGVLSAPVMILPAPQDVQAQAAEEEASITLTWAAAAGATSYQVYRSTSANTGYISVGTTSSLSYTDENLNWRTAYYYKIQALNTTTSGASPLSAEASATTPTPLGYYSVGTTAEMNAAIQSVKTASYSTFTIALTGSLSLNTVSLSRSSSNAVLTIISEGAGEKIINLSSLSIGSGISLVLEQDVTLEGLDSGDRLVQIASGSSFTMKAGSKVHGNTGGGVYVNGGTFTMSGGAISGNSSYTGGGVYVSSGTFTLSGGEISGNTASYSYSSSYGGGGVYVGGGTFTMSGGAISGNSSSGYVVGGGVNVNGGTFTMSGGEISGNSSFSSNGGGGVFVYTGTFTLSNGEISGNSASSGGGVFVRGGTFTMSGGAISGNTASSSGGGGGVYVNSSGTFIKQSGGVIYGSDGGSLQNIATNGQAVRAYNGNRFFNHNGTAGVGVLLNSNDAWGWQ
jgi:fibronectin type 3 domain-containing protein